MWMIQLMEAASDEADAGQMLAGLQQQVDFKGGRTLPARGDGTPWRVQAFFEDVSDASWLPDGLRRVIVLPQHYGMFGIQA